MIAVLVLLLPGEFNPMMLSCILVGIGAVISSMPNILISDLASPWSVGKLMGINRVFADSGYFLGTIVTGMILGGWRKILESGTDISYKTGRLFAWCLQCGKTRSKITAQLNFRFCLGQYD